MLASSFTVGFHAQRHQKLSISENDKISWRHCDVIRSATTTKLFSNIAYVFIWSYATFNVHSSSGFGDIPRNVKGGNFMPPRSGSWVKVGIACRTEVVGFCRLCAICQRDRTDGVSEIWDVRPSLSWVNLVHCRARSDLIALPGI